ncbi:LysE family transporter [Xanthomarina sp. F1114]|uniref:LysE family transporter n=1 Tax=Xanthomarina sp. F1114 TaxID=2996019 RepID=UPI00225E2108|nr:LysE family transporter [Xanthomarina sp. F1114]MCX7546996.1 LysE family transporter [Xanthomarina sp. F1114]
MDLALVLFLGFLATFTATMPPGLINITAAKISLKEGLNRGVMFALGACTIVVFQSLIATIFARYLSNHPDVIGVLRTVALVIFALLSIYFLFIAKSSDVKNQEVDSRSKTKRFFHGMFLSAINFFPIPYQAYIAVTIASFGILEFDNFGIGAFVIGCTLGTFFALYLYIRFFEKIKDHKIASQKSMNYLIGIITGVVAIITLINILKDLYEA